MLLHLTALFLSQQEEASGNVDSELATVISSIAVACKQIANLVSIRNGASCATATKQALHAPQGRRHRHSQDRELQGSCACTAHVMRQSKDAAWRMGASATYSRPSRAAGCRSRIAYKGTAQRSGRMREVARYCQPVCTTLTCCLQVRFQSLPF